ncbi:hypothetical protein MSAN_00579700 [Mycena sanguinolenta]|uniref:Uncharacterized protein n=1 Tax=Mycena sanguinolenta TaxID=230812 RepID=A0A8H6ZA84_9AGAR|nr:hypothetical protein MSAN_00579700 [Mycena sanguinolenta]
MRKHLRLPSRSTITPRHTVVPGGRRRSRRCSCARRRRLNSLGRRFYRRISGRISINQVSVGLPSSLSEICAIVLVLARARLNSTFDAWTRVINGDDFDAIPGMEWDAQPFAQYVPAPGSSSVTPTRTSLRGWFKLGWLSQLSFMGRFMLSKLLDPKEVGYVVRVPKVFLNEAKQKIMDELKAQGSSEYVGSSDVLMAWWHKTVYSYRAPTDHTPVHLHFPCSLRSRSIFAQDGPLAHPYINNAVAYLPVPPIPVNTFATESLGELALRVRRAIVAYNADAASLRADLHWLFEGSNAAKMLFLCPPGAEFSITTNWRDGKLGALDFSGAVVSDSRSEDAATRVVFAYYSYTPDTIPMRGVGAVMMEDEDVVWMRQFRGSKDWERIRQSGVVAFAGQ